MTGMITLISKTAKMKKNFELELRPAHPDDIDALSRLYFASYEDAIDSQDSAHQEIQQVFAGQRGEFYPEASLVLVDEHDRIVAAALCLKDRQDGVTPADRPTIYQLFTAASRRREGLAEKLIRRSIDVMSADGYDEVTVHVQESNYPALALYLTLDFRRWMDEDEEL